MVPMKRQCWEWPPLLPQVPEYTIAPCMAMWIGVWREVPSSEDTWETWCNAWGGGWWEVSQRLQPVCPGTRGSPLEWQRSPEACYVTDSNLGQKWTESWGCQLTHCRPTMPTTVWKLLFQRGAVHQLVSGLASGNSGFWWPLAAVNAWQ